MIIINAQFIQIHPMFDVELHNSICSFIFMIFLFTSQILYEILIRNVFCSKCHEWNSVSIHSLRSIRPGLGDRCSVFSAVNSEYVTVKGEKLIYFLHYEWKMGNCENVDEQSKTHNPDPAVCICVGLHTPHLNVDDLMKTFSSLNNLMGDKRVTIYSYFSLWIWWKQRPFCFFFCFHCHQTHNT